MNITDSPASKAAAQTPRVKARRAQARRLKALVDMLASLEEPPTLEAFLYFDYDRYEWWVAPDKGYNPDLGGSPARWVLRPRERGNLNTVLQRFRVTLARDFSAGWYVYRWRIKSSHGMPVLYLHLLGTPGEGHSFEDAREDIAATWLHASGSEKPEMAFIRVVHDAALGDFTSPHAAHFARDLNRLLDGRYEWGRVNLANMKVKPPERTLPLPEDVARQVKDLLIRHHLEYSEAHGVEMSMEYLRMLEADFGRVFVNPAIQEEVMALIAPYMA